MIEHATAGPGLNPYAVSELSLAIQQGSARYISPRSPLHLP